jgi:hypothetical protein
MSEDMVGRAKCCSVLIEFPRTLLLYSPDVSIPTYSFAPSADELLSLEIRRSRTCRHINLI